MKKSNFMLFGVEYRKEFVYLTTEGLRWHKRNYSVEDGFRELEEEIGFGGYSGKFVIFTTSEALRFLKKKEGLEVVENDKGVYVLESAAFRFVNFNQVANISNRVEQVKEKYGTKGDNELELMENFVEFLLSLDVPHRIIASKWLTGIQREIFYRGLSREELCYKDKRFNKMKSSTAEKRRFVYDYLNRCCPNSGILDTTVGEWSDVISIDMSSQYPYILAAYCFMVEDPYNDFYKGQPYSGAWDYLPIKFRQRIVKFYRKKEEGTTGKFYKLCLNSLVGKSISEYELKKNNDIKTSFLCPQHGFQVIEIGRRLLEEMTQKLKAEGFIILQRDTDSIKFQGDVERTKAILKEENDKVVRRLMKSGLTFKEASCGIGQWKFEYKAERFVQTAPKHYTYWVDGIEYVKGQRDETFEIGY